MSDQLYCPECADKWSGAYNTDHRCVTCGSPLKVVPAGGEIERVRAERDALAEQLAEERRGDADLRAILDRVKEERDALAADVARLREEHATGGENWERLMRMGRVLNDAPSLSLARLKAQWQAEACEDLSVELTQKVDQQIACHRGRMYRKLAEETTP